MRVKLRVVSYLPGPHGDKVAVLRSSRLMNQAQEPRSRGGSFVAVALHATAGPTSNRLPPGYRLSLTHMSSRSSPQAVS